MSNCGCIRYADPSGIWDYNSLIGAKVQIKSASYSTSCYKDVNYNVKTTKENNSSIFKLSMDKTFTIEDIYFRCSLDGKVITVILLEDCPGCVFTWKDLELIDVPSKANLYCSNSSVCGELTCGSVEIKIDEDE